MNDAPVLNHSLPESQPLDLFIEGRFVPASSRRRFGVTDPTSGELLAEVAHAGPEDVDLAAQAAHRAFLKWGRTSPRERGNLLFRIASAIRENADELARLETIDGGKAWTESRFGDVPHAADLFVFHGGAADKIRGTTIPQGDQFHTFTERVPFGVIGAITPWNFPLTEAVGKIAPALAAGNTIVLKPSELAPLSCLRLAELCRDVGLPDGVLNVVPGGPETGAALVEHPLIAKITFTGSTAVGRRVASSAGNGLKGVTLELGGKSPFIIFDDADVENAAKSALTGVFYHQGQCCTASTRLLVQKGVANDVVDALRSLAQGLIVGDPMRPETHIGPLISRAQCDRTREHVNQSVEAGATVVTGGGATGDAGYFFEPTILIGSDHTSPSAQQEIFGPVLSVFEFTDEDQGVALANDVDYGLAATVWTSDLGRALRTTNRLEAGTVWVNSVNRWSPEVPFAGWKNSGVGFEHGYESVLETYSRLRSVWMATTPVEEQWACPQ